MTTVIIPSYNRADIIQKSIMSVLNQTISNLELIVVDDGSDDDTELKVKEIKDNRLRYIKLEKNSGACAARNKGICEAKGKYIAFQDSDDTWVKDKLEKQIAFMENKQADMVYCGMSRHIGNKTRYFPSDQKKHEELSLESLLSKNKISTQNILIKKSVAEQVLFDTSFKRLQDWDFSARVLIGGFKIAYLAEPLVDAVVRKDSITSSVNTEEAYKHFINKYKSYYKEYPHALSSVYYTIAGSISSTNKPLAQEYLKKSLKIKFRVKTLLKFAAVSFL